MVDNGILRYIVIYWELALRNSEVNSRLGCFSHAVVLSEKRSTADSWEGPVGWLP